MLCCLGPYRSSLGTFGAGDTIDDSALCAALLRDAPEMFVLVEDAPDARAVEDAPNRMVTRETPGTRRRARTKKQDS